VRYRDLLFETIRPTYQAILDHPFLAGLVDGTLPAEAFRYYVIQDARYLRDYARALAVVGAKATDEDSIVRFCTDAAEAITVERSLHAGFMDKFGLTADELATVPAQPTTLAYTSYLLRTVYQGSFAEAVAVVLPCYWVYAMVGTHLLSRTAAAPSPNQQYQTWIATYGGEEFQAVVAAVLDTVDRIGPELSAPEQARFIEHVVTTTRYEWMFWDAAWRGETWPAELGGTLSQAGTESSRDGLSRAGG
jgi:thiaminase/transcriptional activator TenA